jgi:hypothetical protein
MSLRPSRMKFASVLVLVLLVSAAALPAASLRPHSVVHAKAHKVKKHRSSKHVRVVRNP